MKKIKVSSLVLHELNVNSKTGDIELKTGWKKPKIPELLPSGILRFTPLPDLSKLSLQRERLHETDIFKHSNQIGSSLFGLYLPPNEEIELGIYLSQRQSGQLRCVVLGKDTKEKYYILGGTQGEDENRGIYHTPWGKIGSYVPTKPTGTVNVFYWEGSATNGIRASVNIKEEK